MKVQVTKCDRCKIMMHDEDSATGPMLEARRRLNVYEDEYLDFDLCQNCREELWKWLQGAE